MEERGEKWGGEERGNGGAGVVIEEERGRKCWGRWSGGGRGGWSGGGGGGGEMRGEGRGWGEGEGGGFGGSGGVVCVLEEGATKKSEIFCYLFIGRDFYYSYWLFS